MTVCSLVAVGSFTGKHKEPLFTSPFSHPTATWKYDTSCTHILTSPLCPPICHFSTTRQVTGDHCYHPGYEEFNPPSWGSECAPNKKDWIDLTLEYCGDKKWNPPEEFWACSDISIKAGRWSTSRPRE